LLIDICAYSSADDVSIIQNIIDMLGENIIGYERVLERANFRALFAEVVSTL
jgi:hypothetical protein